MTAIILEYLERMHSKVSSYETELLKLNSISFLEAIIRGTLAVSPGEVLCECCVCSGKGKYKPSLCCN